MALIVSCSVKEGAVGCGFNGVLLGLTRRCNAGALSLRKNRDFGSALEQLGGFPGAGLPGVFRGGGLGLCREGGQNSQPRLPLAPLGRCPV